MQSDVTLSILRHPMVNHPPPPGPTVLAVGKLMLIIRTVRDKAPSAPILLMENPHKLSHLSQGCPRRTISERACREYSRNP